VVTAKAVSRATGNLLSLAGGETLLETLDFVPHLPEAAPLLLVMFGNKLKHCTEAETLRIALRMGEALWRGTQILHEGRIRLPHLIPLVPLPYDSSRPVQLAATQRAHDHGCQFTACGPAPCITRSVAPAGVKHYTAHELRHTYATACLLNGMDLLELQRRLGHADPTTTQVCLHVVRSVRGDRKQPRADLSRDPPASMLLTSDAAGAPRRGAGCVRRARGSSANPPDPPVRPRVSASRRRVTSGGTRRAALQ